MKKIKENILDVGLFLLAITFNPITLVIFVLIGASGCSRDYANVATDEGVIWRVAYIDMNLKMEDYIHSTSENGCKCAHMPYMFSSDYLEIPISIIDSSAAIKRFYDFKDKETYVVYEAYPYCKTKDWEVVKDSDDRKLLTVRSTLVDTWSMCQKFGLIDSKGHYIN
jgi:hypothetical protein